MSIWPPPDHYFAAEYVSDGKPIFRCFVQHLTGRWRAAVVDARQADDTPQGPQELFGEYVADPDAGKAAVEQIIPKLLDLHRLPHTPLTNWIEVQPGQKKVWLDP
jgi:hypothetical protein